MPDFSNNFNDVFFSNPSDLKLHLQHLLDSKEKQLQQAGTLGQRVLAQQMELEERIRQLQEAAEPDRLPDTNDDQLDPEAEERYRELANTIKAWDAENAQLSSAFGNRVSFFYYGSCSQCTRMICPHMSLHACVTSLTFLPSDRENPLP